MNSMRTGVPRLLHELPGDVVDADRLAHVEHQRLAGPADRGGLDDELQASSMVMK